MSSQKKIQNIIDLVESTELNALVIDVKDGHGNLIFDWIRNLQEIINYLHEKNIYLIARIVVFKDSRLAEKIPSIALKTKDGHFWLDNLGGKWVDPCTKEVWQYNLEIAKKAIEIGFDEINFDYIRFPSEGNIEEIVYPKWDRKRSKFEIMQKCFKYFNENLKPYGKPISIDFFAYSIFCDHDLGIGQRFTDIINYFDYACPMVYPSHYRKGNFGFSNPAEHPYEVVYETLLEAKLIILENNAKIKLRPWLQDFGVKPIYDEKMIRLQKRAVYDVLGEDAGWLLWNPLNEYTEEALDIQPILDKVISKFP